MEHIPTKLQQILMSSLQIFARKYTQTRLKTSPCFATLMACRVNMLHHDIHKTKWFTTQGPQQRRKLSQPRGS